MKKLVFLFLSFLPIVASAHNGHGIFDASNILHYITNPEHVLPLGGGIVLLGLLAKRRNRKVA